MIVPTCTPKLKGIKCHTWLDLPTYPKNLHVRNLGIAPNRFVYVGIRSEDYAKPTRYPKGVWKIVEKKVTNTKDHARGLPNHPACSETILLIQEMNLKKIPSKNIFSSWRKMILKISTFFENRNFQNHFSP